MSDVAKRARLAFLVAFGVAVACAPLLTLAERLGWNQRPLHFLQSFVAAPFACVASALFLWHGRSATGHGALRALAWLVFLASGLWLTFLVYVLLFADFSWMNQA